MGPCLCRAEHLCALCCLPALHPVQCRRCATWGRRLASSWRLPPGSRARTRGPTPPAMTLWASPPSRGMTAWAGARRPTSTGGGRCCPLPCIPLPSVPASPPSVLFLIVSGLCLCSSGCCYILPFPTSLPLSFFHFARQVWQRLGYGAGPDQRRAGRHQAEAPPWRALDPYRHLRPDGRGRAASSAGAALAGLGAAAGPPPWPRQVRQVQALPAADAEEGLPEPRGHSSRCGPRPGQVSFGVGRRCSPVLLQRCLVA